MSCTRVELGRAYHKLGKRQEAWRELEAAVLLDQEDINAYLQKVSSCSLISVLTSQSLRDSLTVPIQIRVSGAEQTEQGNFLVTTTCQSGNCDECRV